MRTRSDTLAVLPALVWVLSLLLVGQTSADIYIPDLPRQSYRRSGDFMLGILLPVHMRSPDEFCADAVLDLGLLQRIQALWYAIDQVNENTTILPGGLKLGFIAFDDCYKDVTALAQTMHFSRTTPPEACRSSEAATCDTNTSLTMYDVIGVIGSESSVTTIASADLLTSFRIPQVSYISSSPLLNDRNKYPLFYRMIPSDDTQAKAIVHLLTHFNWTYVSVIYSQGNYGFPAYMALKKEMDASPIGICIAQVFEIESDFPMSEYRKIVFDILMEKNATVVILFMPPFEAKMFFDAAKQLNPGGRITWIATDGWGRELTDIHGAEKEMLGGFSFKIRSRNVRSFDSYFADIAGDSLDVNPWIDDFWTQYFNCTTSAVDELLLTYKPCDQSLRFSSHILYRPEKTVSLVFDAVHTYAHAVGRLLEGECFGLNDTELFHCVRSRLADTIQNLTFRGMSGDVVEFDAQGNRLLPFDIYNIRNSSLGPELNKIADWDPVTEKLTFNEEKIEWSNGEQPHSRCYHRECVKGEQHVFLPKPCCWVCGMCANNQRTVSFQGRVRCETCASQKWPDEETRTRCVDIVPRYLLWDSHTVRALLSVAAVGIAFCVGTAVLFLVNNSHPLIKASSRELSYVMLFGLTSSYAFIYVLLMKPVDHVCYVKFLSLVISFSFIYAPLTTKLIRIYRLFESGRKLDRSPRFVSTKAQLLIVLVILVVHTTFIMVWSSFDKPRCARVEVDVNNGIQHVVCHFPTGPLIANGCSCLVMLLLCSVFAFLNRKLPDNFNESKFILVCVYSTVVLWVAFVPAYFITVTLTKVIFICLLQLLCSTVTLASFFLPKLYAIYFAKTDALHIPTMAPELVEHYVEHSVEAGKRLQVRQQQTSKDPASSSRAPSKKTTTGTPVPTPKRYAHSPRSRPPLSPSSTVESRRAKPVVASKQSPQLQQQPPPIPVKAPSQRKPDNPQSNTSRAKVNQVSPGSKASKNDTNTKTP